MNSKTLKSQHKAVYEQFFQENQIVVSAPFLMTWSGDLSKFYSWITIKQKIPLRLYMGININKSQTISLNNITYFDKVSDTFAKSDILEYVPHFHNVQKHISTERKHLITLHGWIEINILSELPRGIGLGFESIVSFLLATTLYRLAWHIDNYSVEQVNAMPIEDAMKKSDPETSKWLAEGIVFDKLTFWTIISSIKRSSFFSGYYPTITIAKDYDNVDESVQFSLHKSYTFRFNELFEGLKPVPFLPMDYGVIYSGKPMLLEQVIARDKTDSLYLNTIKPELKHVFSPYFSDLSNEEIPKFYKQFIDTENSKTEKTLYGWLMWLISIKILYAMHKLYGNDYNEEYVKFFINVLKKYRRWDYITKESSSSFLDVIKTLTEHFLSSNSILSLFPNDTSIMGGTIGFALPLEWYRKYIVDSVEETKKNFPGVDMIYCSRLDGMEHEGLKFEQDVEKWIFSEFIGEEKHTFRNTDWLHILWDYNELMAIKGQDILLDCTNNKLYVNDKKVTSEELHSQTTTIDVLQMLMKHIGKDVHNKQLPASSYSKNKNTMLSKIVIPFIKLTKKELKKDFPLICKWMLYDFYMRLGKTDIKIGIIEKVHTPKK